MKNEKEWEEQLREEGFRRVFVWRDGPNVFYSGHTHGMATAHIILEGEMTIVSEGKTLAVKAGGRFDVPANTVHSATMGPAGCRYLIGEK